MSSRTTSRGRSRGIGRAVRWALALALLAGVCLSLGCNEIAKWRDSQIQTSHQLGQGSRITPPAQPVQVPAGIASELPLDPSFTILSFTDQGSLVQCQALSAWDATATTEWMLSELARRGYDSGDNPSRILEGVDYTNAKATYQVLHVKVTLNTSDQCIVELTARKEAP